MKPLASRPFHYRQFSSGFVSEVPNARYGALFVCADELSLMFPKLPKTVTTLRLELWQEKPDIPHDRLRYVEIEVPKRQDARKITTYISQPTGPNDSIELDFSIGQYMSRRLPYGHHRLWLSYEAVKYDHRRRYSHPAGDDYNGRRV